MEEHAQHLRIVLHTLREQKLYAMFSKYELGLDSTAFLGHVVSGVGIMVDPRKNEAVQSWPFPTTVIEIMSFLGLADYYRQFVEGYVRAPEARWPTSVDGNTGIEVGAHHYRICGWFAADVEEI
uniref:Uncharacterized mitochondrial protein AtMg00860-like n=1 Tax=Nicotiana tabacum TaxID=4097 RepID=A0A1S4CHW4_TOBAC|nr:PREDICTED: uncharacterized mitochondrial protein AtMg00860-like [Nicotiana tabacum]